MQSHSLTRHRFFCARRAPTAENTARKLPRREGGNEGVRYRHADGRREALIGIASLAMLASSVDAKTLEVSALADGEGYFGELRRKSRELTEKNDEAFENSEFLKGLRDKSSANKARYKKELQDRYCYRQAELGVGDCGGLSLIPGATKSGKQKPPEWLKGVLQKFGKSAPEESGT